MNTLVIDFPFSTANQYEWKPGKIRIFQGLSTRDAALCFLAFSAMGGGPGAVYAVLQAYPSSTVNIVTIGLCVLLEMTCLRYHTLFC